MPLLIVVACGSSTGTGSPRASSEASTAATASALATGESGGPSQGSPGPTDEPSAETAAPGATSTPAGSAGPSVTLSPGSGGGAAGACSGSDENRDFFASMAIAVDWPVYCPVLPDGWFVQNGQYRLADGGRLEIVFTGPQRAQITLDEGAFCTIPGGCVPAGEDIGPTAFGDREGMLIALDDGSWAIALDREAPLSWLLIVTGLDEATARSVAAGLVVVAG